MPRAQHRRAPSRSGSRRPFDALFGHERSLLPTALCNRIYVVSMKVTMSVFSQQQTSSTDFIVSRSDFRSCSKFRHCLLIRRESAPVFSVSPYWGVHKIASGDSDRDQCPLWCTFRTRIERPGGLGSTIRRHMQCSKRPINLGAFGQVLGSLTDYNLASADEDDLSVLRSIAPSHHGYIVEINPNGLCLEIGALHPRCHCLKLFLPGLILLQPQLPL
jgi:hypothetical protein